MSSVKFIIIKQNLINRKSLKTGFKEKTSRKIKHSKGEKN